MLELDREPVNGWLHFAAALVAGAGLYALCDLAAARHSPRHLVAALVFGLSAIAMFSASATYHLRRGSPRALLLKRLDHAMIFVFIAGTYTPVCLVPLWETGWGLPLLLAVWTLALGGIVLKVLRIRTRRVVSVTLYLALGWLGALGAPLLLKVAPAPLFWWILTGGILYTLGAVFYTVKWPRGWPGVFGFHELWHVFVIAACASHYWAVFAYVMPLD